MTDNMFRRPVERLSAEVLRLITDDEGMSTAEYAIGTIAAAAFGAILYTVVTESQDILSLCLLLSSTLVFRKIEPAREPESIDSEPTANAWPNLWDGR